LGAQFQPPRSRRQGARAGPALTPNQKQYQPPYLSCYPAVPACRYIHVHQDSEHENKPIQSPYEIRVDGDLSLQWSEWFAGFTITVRDDGTTHSGAVADQAALYGLLRRVRDLGRGWRDAGTDGGKLPRIGLPGAGGG